MKITGIFLAAVCAAALGGVALAGCGADDRGTDSPAGRVADQYVNAYNDRDFDQVCNLLSESYKRERELVPGSAEEPEEEGELETSCPEYFKEHTGGAVTTLTLVDVQDRGAVASAHIRSESEDTPGHEADETIGLARQQDGSWKVTDITAYTGTASG
jgi:ketosteroid isomerase-like protein